MSKKRYLAVRQVREFMAEQPDECQAQYLAMVERLEQDGYLIEPFAKKIDRDVFELRIRRGRHIRVLYCYYESDMVIGVRAFVKKTQKMPIRELREAKRIISVISRGEYHE